MKTKEMKKKRPASLKLPAPRLRRRPVGTAESKGSVVSSLKLKRILVPTDFSAPSLKAVRYAVRFAKQSGATIDLLYVIERPVLHDFENFPLVQPEDELARLCKEKLLSMAASEIEELIPIRVQVRIGKPFREIVEAAREVDTDLIVMATQGNSGIKHLLLGSTSELVVREAPCPVLVVRELEHEFV